jgi:hypothetical protein
MTRRLIAAIIFLITFVPVPGQANTASAGEISKGAKKKGKSRYVHFNLNATFGYGGHESLIQGESHLFAPKAHGPQLSLAADLLFGKGPFRGGLRLSGFYGINWQFSPERKQGMPDYRGTTAGAYAGVVAFYRSFWIGGGVGTYIYEHRSNSGRALVFLPDVTVSAGVDISLWGPVGFVAGVECSVPFPLEGIRGAVTAGITIKL